MAQIRHLDLFSGIGGFALAARLVGWETVGFCEIDPYCQRGLAKHWPRVPIHDDIRRFEWREPVDIITAGFPCQPFSVAGKRAGADDERHLWPELARVLGEIRPRYAVLENVPGLLSGGRGYWFGEVLGDLAEIGYNAEWHVISAADVGAPHLRKRVWIIAYPSEPELRLESGRRHGENGASEAEPGNDGTQEFMAYAGRERQLQPKVGVGEIGRRLTNGGWWATEPDVGRVADGIPRRVDRLKALGNAIVPQVAEVIFRSLEI